jgi:hypothetical protein
VDLDRRAKIAFANAINGRHVLDEFWPSSSGSERLFQPEPGCSEPTFVGSAADVFGRTSHQLMAALSAQAANSALRRATLPYTATRFARR